MFDALSKAYLNVKEKDEEKLQRRKTKRFSKVSDETDSTIRLKSLAESQSAFERSSIRPVSPGSDDIEEDDDDLLEDRPKWDNEYIVLVFMVGYAAGLSNVWRFGYLCKTHGGIVFLIPYIILTMVCAFPCLYLEMLVGQFTQVGAIASWKLCPLFKGVGLCMVLLTFMACFNIQSVLAWCLFYMFQSAFHTPLPWISCDNGFGRLKSGQKDESQESWFKGENDHELEATNWHTVNCTEFFADAGTAGSLESNQRLPGSEFFRGRVQRMWKSRYADSDIDKNFSADNGVIVFGLDSKEVGGILEYNADTLISLIFVFFVTEIIVAKGIKINAKVMLVVVVTPYVLLILLFYRATGLSGAWEGLGELFEPDISQLFSTETWWTCAELVFYSTGAGYGVHLTAASHNAVNRRIVCDAIFVVVANSLTSLVSACTIFMFLGHVKVTLNKDLLGFVRSGPQMVFEVMSDILGVLPKANFYAFCFYTFLFVLALTTVTGSLICAKISYLEVLPVAVKYKSGARMLLVAFIYAISFIVSSLNLTRGGLHCYEFIGIFVGLYSLVLCALLFVVGIAWFFGLRGLTEATKAMGIRCPGIYYQICWKFVSPICIGAVFFGIAVNTGSHTVSFDGRDIELGIGLIIVGYIIGLGPFLAVLGGAFHALWKAPGKNFKEKLLITISPSSEHPTILATGTGERAKWSHYFYLYQPNEGANYNICCSFHSHSKVAPEETEPTGTAKVDGNDTAAGNKQNSDPNAKSNEGNDPKQGPSPKAPQVLQESKPPTEQKPKA